MSSSGLRVLEGAILSGGDHRHASLNESENNAFLKSILALAAP